MKTLKLKLKKFGCDVVTFLLLIALLIFVLLVISIMFAIVILPMVLAFKVNKWWLLLYAVYSVIAWFGLKKAKTMEHVDPFEDEDYYEY